MQCKDVMLNLVYRCHQDAAAIDCARLMLEESVGFIPIVDNDNKVIGVVTDRDLVLRVIAEDRSSRTAVKDIMSPGPILSCRPDDNLHELEDKMAAQKKSRAVVITAEGKLVGVISLSDIAQAERSSARTGKLLKQVARRESVSIARS